MLISVGVTSILIPLSQVRKESPRLVEVRVELPHYLFYRRAVILGYICPTLGIQHCPYSRGPLVELLYDGPSLYNDRALMIIVEVTVSNLIPLEMGVVVYQLGILLIRGGIDSSYRLTRDWPVSGGIVTLYVLHHNLWLGLEVMSLL